MSACVSLAFSLAVPLSLPLSAAQCSAVQWRCAVAPRLHAAHLALRISFYVLSVLWLPRSPPPTTHPALPAHTHTHRPLQICLSSSLNHFLVSSPAADTEGPAHISPWKNLYAFVRSVAGVYPDELHSHVQRERERERLFRFHHVMHRLRVLQLIRLIS